MARSTSRVIARSAFLSIASFSESATSVSEAVEQTASPNRLDFEIKLTPERDAFLQPNVQSSVSQNRPYPLTPIDPLDDLIPKIEELVKPVSSCVPRASPKCIADVVSFLLEAQIPPEKVLSCIHRYPELLNIDSTNLRSQTKLFREMGMKKTAVFEMLLSHPEIFGFDFETDIKSILSFLSESLGSDTIAVDLISQAPVVLTYDLENEIRRNIAFLQGLGFDHADLHSVLETYPSILSLSIKRSIEPKIDYLLSRLPDMDIKFAILSFPGFLDMSLETHIKEKVEFFLDFLNVDPQKFSTYLPHFPQIFSCEIENNIKRKIEFFCLKMNIVQGKRKDMKIVKRESLGFMACPSLFGMSQTHLIMRIEKIRGLIFRNDEILDHLFITCPLLFGSTVDIEDVSQVMRCIVDGVNANRFRVFSIVKQHPEILLCQPDDVETVVESLKEGSVTQLTKTLSDRQKFEAFRQHNKAALQLS